MITNRPTLRSTIDDTDPYHLNNVDPQGKGQARLETLPIDNVTSFINQTNKYLYEYPVEAILLDSQLHLAAITARDRGVDITVSVY